MLGEHDYQDKRWMLEQSQRMPLMVRYPKRIKAGQRLDTLVENVDFAPTLLEFAGATIPATVQGRSFWPLLESGREPDDWKKETYYRYWMHMAHHDNPAHVGLRTKTHKLIFYYGCNYDGGYRTPPGWELYDLVNDPDETINIYDDINNKDLVTELKTRLATLRRQIGDDGSHYPACEVILQEYWDYDPGDREKAIHISHEFLARRLGELARGDRTPKTSVGTDHE
jgi:N-acetylglucosamine-6-sulfatase